MTKLPVFGTIISEAFITFKRFPGVLICSIAAAFALSYHLQIKYEENHNWLIYFIFTCSIGAVLFFNAYLYFERNKISGRDKLLYSGVIIAALIIYFMLQPQDLNRISIVRFGLISLGLHLMVSFVAFIKYDEPNGFWHFNQRIFIRLFISALYSLVLFAGASLALVTIDYLFDVNFNSDNYLRTFYFIFIIFNSWVFLNGVPSNIENLEKDESFPKLLKFFSQFVLLPLVTIYIVILYVYVIRLFIIGSAPDTSVAYMVLALAIVGILALLLVWPMNKLESYKWIRVYQKSFYIILLPLIVLFFVAIWHRVRDYGITENRYFVLVLALWLFGIALYFIFSKKQKIKMIPMSLCAIVFLSSFGPWGAIKFSRVSQLIRFETILTNNNLLQNGKAVQSENGISDEESDKLYSVTKYLVDVFGLKVIQPFFNPNLDSIAESQSINKYSNAYFVLEQLNIKDREKPFQYGAEEYFSLKTIDSVGLDLKNYKLLYTLNTNSFKESVKINYGNSEIAVALELEPLRMVINLDGIKDDTVVLEDTLLGLIKLNEEENITILKSKLIFSEIGNHKKYKLIIRSVDGYYLDSKIDRIQNMNCMLLVGEN